MGLKPCPFCDKRFDDAQRKLRHVTSWHDWEIRSKAALSVRRKEG